MNIKEEEFFGLNTIVPYNIIADMYNGRWNEICEIKIGTDVIKCNSRTVDPVQDGICGTVLGNFKNERGGIYLVSFESLDFVLVVRENQVKKR